MNGTKTTPEFDLLATAAKFIEKEISKENDAWHESPFEW
jgi:hypothetical protein